MNPEIRADLDARLKARGMSRADLARATGAHPNAITRALNDTGGRGGSIPLIWAAMLDALDLELTTRPRPPGAGTGAGQEGGSAGG